MITFYIVIALEYPWISSTSVIPDTRKKNKTFEKCLLPTDFVYMILHQCEFPQWLGATFASHASLRRWLKRAEKCPSRISPINLPPCKSIADDPSRRLRGQGRGCTLLFWSTMSSCFRWIRTRSQRNCLLALVVPDESDAYYHTPFCPRGSRFYLIEIMGGKNGFQTRDISLTKNHFIRAE